MYMAEATLAGKKVIIVEDDPLLHNLLTDKMAQLREKGLEVIPVLNAEEGLEKARETKPDLIMLDLVLPGMTGFEFLEKLRAEPTLGKTPVVVLSNLSDDSDKEKAKKLGVVAYLVKADFSLSDISSAIEEVLGGRPVTPHASPEPGLEKTSKGYMIYL